MLIRFFKEIDLIGCGGDTQPIRLQVGTLSQSDYRCTCRGCTCSGCAQGMCTQGVCMQGWWGHSANQITGGDTQPIRLQVHAGGTHAGVVGTLSQSDYTGLRARMCVQGLCAGGVHAGGECTGDMCTGGVRTGDAHTGGVHAGDVRAGGACAGVVGTLSQSDYGWGHSANQITGVCRGCTCRGGGDT